LHGEAAAITLLADCLRLLQLLQQPVSVALPRWPTTTAGEGATARRPPPPAELWNLGAAPLNQPPDATQLLLFVEETLPRDLRGRSLAAEHQLSVLLREAVDLRQLQVALYQWGLMPVAARRSIKPALALMHPRPLATILSTGPFGELVFQHLRDCPAAFAAGVDRLALLQALFSPAFVHALTSIAVIQTYLQFLLKRSQGDWLAARRTSTPRSTWPAPPHYRTFLNRLAAAFHLHASHHFTSTLPAPGSSFAELLRAQAAFVTALQPSLSLFSDARFAALLLPPSPAASARRFDQLCQATAAFSCDSLCAYWQSCHSSGDSSSWLAPLTTDGLAP
jgi:hypothetical protein